MVIVEATQKSDFGRFFYLALRLSLLSVFLVAGVVQAQNAVPVSPATETAAPAADQTISALSQQIEQHRLSVTALRDRADTLVTDAKTVQDQQAGFGMAVRDVEQGLADMPQADELRHMRGQWEARRDGLQKNIDDVSQLLLALEDEKKQLLELLQQWNAAFSQPEKTVAAPAARKKTAARPDADKIEKASIDVRGMGQQQINELFAIIDTRLPLLNTLLHDAQSLKQQTENVLQKITNQEPRLNDDLFRQSHPPVWSLPEGYFSARLEKGSVTLLEKWEGAIAYLLQQRTTVMLLLFVYVVTLYLMLQMRNNPKLQQALAESTHLRFGLLGRPYSTAVAVTCLSGFLVKDLPPLLFVALALLAMLPVLRLGAPAFSHRFRPLLWLVSLLFLLGQVGFATRDLPGINRLGYLLQSVFIVAVCLVWVPRITRTEFSKLWQKWLVTSVLQFSTLLGFFTLAANLIGAVTIVALLLPALIMSLYFGMAALIMASIVTDLIYVITQLPAFNNVKSFREHRQVILSRVRRIGLVVAALVWLGLTLQQFLVYDWVHAEILHVLHATLAIGQITLSLGDICAIVVTLWLSIEISRFLRFVFNEEIVPRHPMPRGLPTTVSTLLHYVVVLTGFVLAMGAAGVDLSRLAILAGALGIGIGIGLQDVINNFSAGLILLIERHIRPGDIVQTDTVQGVVTQIGLRASIVRTGEGAEVVVPNGKLTSAQVVNWTRSDSQRRIAISVRTAFTTNPEQVISILLDVAKNTTGLLARPAPVAFVLRFGEAALEFELRVWVENSDHAAELVSSLHINILNALHAADIEIAHPAPVK
ncbi:MAG TPA: mechanosensitive ion channel [Pseudomonadales bacterium]|nr:mechanosensitive ion channel [Pseudomonadales bacterium]